MILILVMLILIVGCGKIEPEAKKETVSAPEVGVEDETEAFSSSETVTMKDGVFDKSNVIIKKGGSVTWVNEDSKPYYFIIYYREFSNGDYQIRKVPSGVIEPGKEFRFTFEQTGEHSVIPLWYGKLRGVVLVTE